MVGGRTHQTYIQYGVRCTVLAETPRSKRYTVRLTPTLINNNLSLVFDIRCCSLFTPTPIGTPAFCRDNGRCSIITR